MYTADISICYHTDTAENIYYILRNKVQCEGFDFDWKTDSATAHITFDDDQYQLIYDMMQDLTKYCPGCTVDMYSTHERDLLNKVSFYHGKATHYVTRYSFEAVV